MENPKLENKQDFINFGHWLTCKIGKDGQTFALEVNQKSKFDGKDVRSQIFFAKKSDMNNDPIFKDLKQIQEWDFGTYWDEPASLSFSEIGTMTLPGIVIVDEKLQDYVKEWNDGGRTKSIIQKSWTAKKT